MAISNLNRMTPEERDKALGIKPKKTPSPTEEPKKEKRK